MTRPDLDTLAALLDKAQAARVETIEIRSREYSDLIIGAVNALPALIDYVRELEQQVQACGIRPRGKSVAPEAYAAVRAMREKCAQSCESHQVNRPNDPLANSFDGACRHCAAAIRGIEP